MQAIGYAEGVLFAKHLINHYDNIKSWFLESYLDRADDYAPEIYELFR